MAHAAAARQRRWARLLAFAAGTWLVTAMAAAAETLEQRAERLAAHFEVTLPVGAAPFPVVVMLHGCGGRRPFMQEMAHVAATAGAAVINVDSFAPRGISRTAAIATVCTGMRLHGRERAGDLYAALAWARTQTWADAERFGVIGWSHGGWTILDALALRTGPEMERATRLQALPPEPLQGLAATLIVYPYAGVGSLVGRRPWRVAPASTAIVAERDFIVGDVRVPLERQRGHGAPLDVLVFHGATHAFEDAHAEDPRVRFNPRATEREHGLIRAMVEALKKGRDAAAPATSQHLGG
ncbi:MAG: dienelactone hydrolase family protein [Hyphomonadaceae bacterium]|nr:dienelactone hydrolase family protein [Hyphomonadaceae bacterium]